MSTKYQCCQMSYSNIIVEYSLKVFIIYHIANHYELMCYYNYIIRIVIDILYRMKLYNSSHITVPRPVFSVSNNNKKTKRWNQNVSLRFFSTHPNNVNLHNNGIQYMSYTFMRLCLCHIIHFLDEPIVKVMILEISTRDYVYNIYNHSICVTYNT